MAFHDPDRDSVCVLLVDAPFVLDYLSFDFAVEVDVVLVAQQQPDGGYGTGSDDRVTLTVDCVWTLGELLAPGFTRRCRAAHQQGERPGDDGPDR